MQLKRRLSHAQGYLSLGMVAEASAELEKIPSSDHDNLDVMAVRLALLQEQRAWPALAALAGTIVRRAPAEAAAWITWAYATRRADSLTAAEKILLEAERTHPADATIQFNLGCYAAQRGALRLARERVDRAIALEPKFAAAAALDPDLEPLRNAKDADCPPTT